MRRGTTPTNTFTLDLDLSAATVFITYGQSGKPIIEKTGEDLTFGTTGSGQEQVYTITVELTQEDTLKFRPGGVDIQIRYIMADGTADASNIIKTTFDGIIKDGVIEYV